MAVVPAHTVAAALNALPYARGASWDPDKGCLPGTRKAIFDDVWNWIDSPESANSAEVLWICDVAGSGKSSVAHSLCQQAKEKGMLWSCFFFDRMSAERNSPEKFVSTLVRDLAARDQRVAGVVAGILENDPSLCSASITRQFEGILLHPALASYHRNGTRLLVVDALDEACDKSLLALFCHGVRKLPRNWRIVLTSRPLSHLTRALQSASHVKRYGRRLHGSEVLSDVELFIRSRLLEITALGSFYCLAVHSEGLFQWASTAIDSLACCSDAERQIHLIHSLVGSNALGERMDILYAALLQGCPWEDDSFVQGYQQVVGTIVTVREPISCCALDELYQKHPHSSMHILEQMGAFMSGYESPVEAVRLLHLSLRDYL
ncbi:hypothetical protein CALCODRAFT_432914, partial [Calocera cornea HHB12733]